MRLGVFVWEGERKGERKIRTFAHPYTVHVQVCIVCARAHGRGGVCSCLSAFAQRTDMTGLSVVSPE